MDKKILRLHNLAKEIGVGVGTLMDFFTKEGYSDINPNSKINDEMQRKALKKFSSDLQLQKKVEQQIERENKEANKTIEVHKEQDKEEKNEKNEIKEEKKIIIDEKPTITGPKVIGKIDLNQNKKEEKNDKTQENQSNEQKIKEQKKHNRNNRRKTNSFRK